MARPVGRHELAIIDAVGARVPTEAVDTLSAQTGVRRVHADRSVNLAGGAKPDFDHVTHVQADVLHRAGVRGDGVTVAVIDSGWWYSYDDLKNDLDGDTRWLAEYEAIRNKMSHIKDQSGHGTHVTSIIISSKLDERGIPQGIAPMAKLVEVKAFERDGTGTYADVIRGLDWVVANKETYDIRVLNLSFGAPAQSHYREDP